MAEALDTAEPMPRIERLRDYPVNSAHAAARLVGAALLANGRIKAVELAALDALDAPAALGLARRQWDGVLSNLRADLVGTHRPGEAPIHGAVLHRILDEVTDPRLQRLVAGFSETAVHADHLVEGAEVRLLEVMQRRWGVDIGTLAAAGPDRARRRALLAPQAPRDEHWLLTS